MYPITRESVIVVISSSVAENAVCWCDGRKKRNRRILRRLTHLAAWWRVIGKLESEMVIGNAYAALDCHPEDSRAAPHREVSLRKLSNPRMIWSFQPSRR